MRSHHAVRFVAALLAATTLVFAPVRAQEVVRTFAVRMDGRVVGSVTETETPVDEEGRKMLRFTSSSLVKSELLGASIDQRIEQAWLLDPATRGVLRFTSTMTLGAQKTSLGRKRSTVRCSSTTASSRSIRPWS